MNVFKVGYGRVNIDPPFGIGVAGYYVPRYAKGFLDSLEAAALAFSFGNVHLLLVSIDTCCLNTDVALRYRTAIEAACGIPKEHIFLAASHTHTGPLTSPFDGFNSDEAVISRYTDFLETRLCDVCRIALETRKPANMGFITGYAPERVAYIRRYKMKDGSTMTCPPINDPNIDYPIGTLDQQVHVLRFDRDGSDTIILVNYGLHADTVNGELISADWPGVMRRTLETALDNVKVFCLIGAEGDVGSTNVHPSGGDMNDTEISFDNEMKSPGMARFVGRALAGTVLQVYDKAEYVDVNRIAMMQHVITVPANVPASEDLPRAHHYAALHEAGRDEEIPYAAMELTTVVAEAMRMCRLENGPDYFELELTGVCLGDIALIGLPGEPFTEIGVQIKDTEGWKMIMPCCLTNGSEGYFPMKDAFDEGGYEARSSSYRSGVGEAIITGGKQLLHRLRAE